MGHLFLSSLLFFTLSSVSFADSKSLCGGDDRTYSYLETTARIIEDLTKNTGCTATMISEDCAITAGHCSSILGFLEFNVPHPQDDQSITRANKEDRYTINKSSLVYLDKVPGKDWAVFRVNPNEFTGKLPGEVYGYEQVSFKKPKKRSMLNITGYGSVRGNRRLSGLQRTSAGKLKGFGFIFKHSFTYKVDTEPGNSGSVVIDQASNKVVGIHTSGGCSSSGGENMGTLIYKNKPLIAAIKSCLQNSASSRTQQ